MTTDLLPGSTVIPSSLAVFMTTSSLAVFMTTDLLSGSNVIPFSLAVSMTQDLLSGSTVIPFSLALFFGCGFPEKADMIIIINNKLYLYSIYIILKLF